MMKTFWCVAAAALVAGCGGNSKNAGDDEAGGTGAGGGSAARGGSGGAGGSAARGGTGGAGGNSVVSELRQGGRTKLDVLVMVDNSSSMGGKQRLLADAIPVLVNRLITPICVDAEGTPVGALAPNCPNDSHPEFKPLEDIHLGVITSSLGDHGSGDLCSSAVATAADTFDDRAQLVPTIREGLPTGVGSGFLAWGPDSGGVTPDAAIQTATSYVLSAGERGCGHEAQLESWYRFLVDPEPVASMSHDPTLSVRGPVNGVVLSQRASFLRPDSLLAIILLTDENDCSFIDENDTQGWLAMYRGGSANGTWHMPRGTSACVDPNSPDCAPCTPASAADSACSALGPTLTAAEDNPNLRCYRMKERFGIDLKYPVSRYVEALTSPTIDPRGTGARLPNPLFTPGSSGESPRTRDDVVVLGIVGVPWQDLATDGSTSGQPNSLDPASRELRFMTAAELDLNGRWDVILGNESGPADPFMVESVDARPIGAAHPFLPGVAVTPPGGTLNAVNGTEQAVPATPFDLQFACTFPLEPPNPCTDLNDQGCDCNASDAEQQSPLCEYADPTLDGVQVRAKAYPSVRELELLRELGPNAVVASVCPKNVAALGASTSSDPDYGYNPAIDALVRRLKESLTTRCLPRPLPVSEGSVSCTVVEMRAPVSSSCACDALKGRAALSPAKAGLRAAIEEENFFCRVCLSSSPEEKNFRNSHP